MASIIKADVWQNTAGVPYGTVLGYNSYFYPSVNDNYVVISGDTDYDTSVSVTYSPKFASSILVVQAALHTRMNGAFGMSLGIKRDGTKQLGNYNVAGNDFYYKSASTNHHHTMNATIKVSANTTAATTFTVWMRPYSGGGGSGEWSQGWGQSFIQVWEIQS